MTQVKRVENGIEIRFDDNTSTILSLQDAHALSTSILENLDWTHEVQDGVQVEASGPCQQVMNVERWLSTIRVTGMHVIPTVMKRHALVAPWQPPHDIAAPCGTPPTVRRFTKEKAMPPRRNNPKQNLAAKVRAEPAPLDLPHLFDAPEEQLRYELRHAYLLTVPTAQRHEWKWPEFEIHPMFLADVQYQGNSGLISRAMMIGATVDVLCGRIRTMPQRNAKRLRLRDDPNAPYVVRSSDGAWAWRASVTRNSPQARRIMWWVTTDDWKIELVRLAHHDDYTMPEY